MVRLQTPLQNTCDSSDICGKANELIYRTDIDGLRAIAVILVVVFHINEALIPGGFVGVDMFFVISGYLITGILLRDIEDGQFSFAEFYRRRAKRIFPAVFVVTLATLIAGAWILLPDDMVALSKSAFATMLFIANIFFTVDLDTGYFAADSRTIPLLHMWSLGVEEQFYLLWPVLLLGLVKAPRLCLPLLALLGIASVALGEMAIREGWFSFAYYMLPTRAFQLLAGAMLIFAERQGRFAITPGMAFFTGVSGLLAVIGSAAFLHGETAYPGVHALPVTIGTMLLLASGRIKQPLAAVLSLKPVRWIGLISFSLYLWHWPVLAFQRYLTPELGWQQQVVSLAVMLLLSQLTFRLVEKPFREKQVTFRAALRRYWLYPGLCVGAIVTAHIATEGYGFYALTDLRHRLESQSHPAFRLPFVCQAAQLTSDKISDPECVLGDSGALSTLLLGDSNAAHFVGAFDQVARSLGFRFRNIAHSACPPVVGDTRLFTSASYDETCSASRQFVRETENAHSIIILAASWDSYEAKAGDEFLAAISATVEEHTANGKKVLIVGVVPRQRGFDRFCAEKKMKLRWLQCENPVAAAEQPAINKYLQDLAATFPAVWYLDPYIGLCVENGCPALVDGHPLYFDAGHLSQAGSRRLGDLWMKDNQSNTVLRHLFGSP